MVDAQADPALPLTARVQRGEAALATWRERWWAAHAAAPQASLFLRPDFIERSWSYLREPGDEPWLVTVEQGAALVGLLPLRLGRSRYYGLNWRTLTHLALPAGERPGILHTTPDAAPVWAVALQALLDVRAHWQAIEWRELDEGAWPLSTAAHQRCQALGLTQQTVFNNHWAWCLAGLEATPLPADAPALVSLAPELDRRLPGWRLERHGAAATAISAAWDRHAAVEARALAGLADAASWYDPRHADLYRDWLPTLAARGEAEVQLLGDGRRDIASLVRLRHRGTVAERFVAIDPDWVDSGLERAWRAQALLDLADAPPCAVQVMGSSLPIELRPAVAPLFGGRGRTFGLRIWNPSGWQRPVFRLRRWVAARRA